MKIPALKQQDLPTIAVVSCVLLSAAALRIYGLGTWPLEGDELNTLRDSLVAQRLLGGKPKALLFILNYHLIASWTELDELGLRLLPALFGIVAVLVIFWVGRLLNPRTGILAAVLVAFSPWHVYWSQYARYYTLVFLLSAIFPVALYLGLRQRSVKWLLIGTFCAVLAVLAHAASGVLLAGLIAWLVGARYLREDHPGEEAAVGHGGVWVIGGLLIVAGVVVGLPYLLRILSQWIDLGQRWGHHGVALILSYVDWLSIGLVAFGAAGLVWLWDSGERDKALLLAAILAIPTALLALLSIRISISTAYLFATAPYWYVGAAYFLDRLANLTTDKRRQLLIVTTCLAALLGEVVPRLISHLRDGGRPDFRAAARRIEASATSRDLVLSDQPRSLGYYSRSTTIEPLPHDAAALASRYRDLESMGESQAMWIVEEVRRRGGFNERNMGDAADWVNRTCRLHASIQTPRLDFKHNELRVYHCPGDRARPTSADYSG